MKHAPIFRKRRGLASGVWRLASVRVWRLASVRVWRLASISVPLLVLAGCSTIQRTPPLQVWSDMRMQPRFEAQGSTGLFPDGRQSRRRPEGVVARGRLMEDNVFNTGLLDNGFYVGRMPVEITDELLTEGHWRFNTYCSPCHDETGLGMGMVPQRAANFHPANLMDQRVVDFADGDIFNVITYGRRTMPPYGAQNEPAQRWAIIAYVRVLQRSAHGTVSDVPEDLRSSLEYKPPPPGSEPPPPVDPNAPVIAPLLPPQDVNGK